MNDEARNSDSNIGHDDSHPISSRKRFKVLNAAIGVFKIFGILYAVLMILYAGVFIVMAALAPTQSAGLMVGAVVMSIVFLILAGFMLFFAWARSQSIDMYFRLDEKVDRLLEDK